MEGVPQEFIEAMNFSNGERMALVMLVRQLMQGRPELQLPMSRAVERFKDAPQFAALSAGEREGFLSVMKKVL